jgi:hypothetical protein
MPTLQDVLFAVEGDPQAPQMRLKEWADIVSSPEYGMLSVEGRKQVKEAYAPTARDLVEVNLLPEDRGNMMIGKMVAHTTPKERAHALAAGHTPVRFKGQQVEAPPESRWAKFYETRIVPMAAGATKLTTGHGLLPEEGLKEQPYDVMLHEIAQKYGGEEAAKAKLAMDIGMAPGAVLSMLAGGKLASGLSSLIGKIPGIGRVIPPMAAGAVEGAAALPAAELTPEDRLLGGGLGGLGGYVAGAIASARAGRAAKLGAMGEKAVEAPVGKGAAGQEGKALDNMVQQSIQELKTPTTPELPPGFSRKLPPGPGVVHTELYPPARSVPRLEGVAAGPGTVETLPTVPQGPTIDIPTMLDDYIGRLKPPGALRRERHAAPALPPVQAIAPSRAGGAAEVAVPPEVPASPKVPAGSGSGGTVKTIIPPEAVPINEAPAVHVGGYRPAPSTRAVLEAFERPRALRAPMSPWEVIAARRGGQAPAPPEPPPIKQPLTNERGAKAMSPRALVRPERRADLETPVVQPHRKKVSVRMESAPEVGRTVEPPPLPPPQGASPQPPGPMPPPTQAIRPRMQPPQVTPESAAMERPLKRKGKRAGKKAVPSEALMQLSGAGDMPEALRNALQKGDAAAINALRESDEEVREWITAQSPKWINKLEAAMTNKRQRKAG